MSIYEQAIQFWQNRHITTDAQLAEVLNGYSVAFAYHSGKLENDNITYNDTREIFDHDRVSSYTGDLKTLFEIRNSRDANELFFQAFQEERLLDEDLVLRFHFALTKNTYDTRRWQLGERPGEYKKHDYVTGRNEAGAAPEDVPEELSELLEEMEDVPKNKLLLAAAYLHAKFENIHPFADGNGRTGRIIMNYFLVRNDHPPVIIHEEDRNMYYAALEAWDEKQELTSLTDFLYAQIEKTWKKRIEKENRSDYPEVSLESLFHNT